MTHWKLNIRIDIVCLLLWMTLPPVTSFSQTDSLICLPVEVIDSTIIELQELDYLREKTVIDQEKIRTLERQVTILDSASSLSTQIIQEESAKSKLWKLEAEAERKEKEWWKWGGIIVSFFLTALTISQ